jgi:hypothetical protein
VILVQVRDHRGVHILDAVPQPSEPGGERLLWTDIELRHMATRC